MIFRDQLIQRHRKQSPLASPFSQNERHEKCPRSGEGILSSSYHCPISPGFRDRLPRRGLWMSEDPKYTPLLFLLVLHFFLSLVRGCLMASQRDRCHEWCGRRWRGDTARQDFAERYI